jgi:hypothetical protein
LNYFPTDEQEGYTFLMNFDANGSVKIATKNRWFANKYEERVSLFRMIADNGPVLTFDTYNALLHFFSNPDDVAGTTDNERGTGLGGDYEFIVMKASENEITLKGKKRGVLMDMRPLAEDQDWVAYFQKLDEMNTTLFSKNVPEIWMFINDSIYTLNNGMAHIFDAVPEGGDPITDVEKVPFIVTDYGIYFVKSFEFGGKQVRKFQLSEDRNTLICIDEGVNAKITGPEVVPFFSESIDNRSLRWTLQESNMSSNVQVIYDRIVQAFKDKKLSLGQISYLYSSRNTTDAVYISDTKKADGYLFFDKKQTSEGINYTFKNDFDPKSNGKVFYNNYDGVADLMQMMSGSFKIESTAPSALNPTVVKLTNVSNPNIWFTVSLQ